MLSEIMIKDKVIIKNNSQRYYSDYIIDVIKDDIKVVIKNNIKDIILIIS